MFMPVCLSHHLSVHLFVCSKKPISILRGLSLDVNSSLSPAVLTAAVVVPVQ